MKIVGISGSLRKNSFNTVLLHEAAKIAPQGMTIEILPLQDIPLYNYDIEQEGVPDSVQKFKAAVAHSNGVLIMTPEYNHSIPGVLKNTIDWVSRGENVWNDKPLAIGGASDGIISTARSQMHLLIVANTLNMHPMGRPLFQVPNANKKINNENVLIDDKTREKLSEFLVAFYAWIERINPHS